MLHLIVLFVNRHAHQSVQIRCSLTQGWWGEWIGFHPNGATSIGFSWQIVFLNSIYDCSKGKKLSLMAIHCYVTFKSLSPRLWKATNLFPLGVDRYKANINGETIRFSLGTFAIKVLVDNRKRVCQCRLYGSKYGSFTAIVGTDEHTRLTHCHLKIGNASKTLNTDTVNTNNGLLIFRRFLQN